MITKNMIIKAKENAKNRFAEQAKYPLIERDTYPSERGNYGPSQSGDEFVDGWGRSLSPDTIIRNRIKKGLL